MDTIQPTEVFRSNQQQNNGKQESKNLNRKIDENFLNLKNITLLSK
jgi:hypothetical protein